MMGWEIKQNRQRLIHQYLVERETPELARKVCPSRQSGTDGEGDSQLQAAITEGTTLSVAVLAVTFRRTRGRVGRAA